MSYNCILHKGKECDGCQDCWDDSDEILSDCCGASIYPDTDICSECKEHCDVMGSSDGEIEGMQEDIDQSEGRNGWPRFFK